ncbi:MAG TPA: cell division protein FtsQ/DivIB [Oxalicibacterium sp.]|jgi:cell division protein FtsQ|nr:cell division protein FtsQ/DivIB [Oxalicibacterium sp.]
MWQDIKMLNATANALYALVALALISAGLWWVAQRPYFTLKTIRVEGAEHVQLRHINPLIVRGAVLSRIKGNFFTANLDNVRQVFESVPWVRKATVRREWPNQLIVTLEEHMPLGTWGDDGRLLSVKGDVFTANLAEAEEDAQLLAFDGPTGSEKEVVTRLNDLNAWLAPLKLQTEKLQLSDRYAWTVTLDNGVTVELGREKSSTTLKDRVDRLVGIYPQLLDRLQNRIENIDMRYPNGLALTAQGLTAGINSKK